MVKTGEGLSTLDPVSTIEVSSVNLFFLVLGHYII